MHGCTGYFGYDTLFLGSNLNIQGGIPPYTYSWQAHHVIQLGSFTNHLYASDLLNDTSSSNPEYVAYYDSIVFRITVQDSLGNSCNDSLLVFNSVIQTHLAYITPSIMLGDSVYLDSTPNLFGGIPPVQYLWRPNQGLRDSTIARGFWAKPDSSIAYYLTVTDSVGCTATAPPLYFVTVNHIGFDEDVLDKKIIAYPNPTNGLIHLRLEEGIEITKVSIATVLGQVVYVDTQPKTEFDISSFREGIYILEIQTEKGIVRKKIEKL